MTPLKASRAKCLDCMCGQVNEVKQCPCTGCSLYPFREGHNPNIKPRSYTEEQKADLTAKMTALRAKRGRGNTTIPPEGETE